MINNSAIPAIVQKNKRIAIWCCSFLVIVLVELWYQVLHEDAQLMINIMSTPRLLHHFKASNNYSNPNRSAT